MDELSRLLNLFIASNIALDSLEAEIAVRIAAVGGTVRAALANGRTIVVRSVSRDGMIGIDIREVQGTSEVQGTETVN